MTTLPCRVCSWAVDWLESLSINPEGWLLGLPVGSDQIGDPAAHLDWNVFLELCDRLAHVGGRNRTLPETGRELGRHVFADPELRDAAADLSLEQLYTDQLPDFLSSAFPGTEARLTKAGNGIIDLRLHVCDLEISCRPFFEIAQGVLSELPGLQDLPAIWVELQQSATYANFRMALFAPADTPKPSVSRPATHAAAASEGEAPAPSIHEMQRAILDAADLDEIAGVIIDQICKPCTGANLWLSRELLPGAPPSSLSFVTDDGAPLPFGPETVDHCSPPSEYELVRKRGDPIKPPSQSIPLSIPGRRIGRVDLWQPAVEDESTPAILEELVPLIGLAIENACLRARPEHEPVVASVEEATTGAGSASNTRWRQLIETAGDLICDVAPDGRLLFVSPQVEQLLGYPPAHFIGKSFLEILLPEERDSILERFRHVVTSGDEPKRISFRAPHASGGIRVLEAVSQSFRDAQDDSLHIVSTLRDVTEQRRTEARLRESEDRFRSLVENTSMLVGVTDTKGRLISTNPRIDQLLKQTRSKGDTRTLLDNVHVEDRSVLVQAWRTTRDTGEPGHCDVRVIAPDSRQVWLQIEWRRFCDAQDEVCLSVVMHDITARKESERALRFISEGLASNEKGFYDSLVENLAKALQLSGSSLSLLDDEAPGHVQMLAFWLRDETQENLRYETAGRPCAHVLNGETCTYPHGAQQLFPSIAEVFGDDIESYAGTPVRDPSGRVLGLLCVVHDRALPDPDLARSTLEIFANRAAAELARELAVTAREDSEARYQAISRSSSDIIVEVARDGGVQYVSPSVHDVLGYSPKKALNAQLIDFVHPEDREPVEHALFKLWNDGEDGQLVFRARHRDDSWRWLETTYRGIHTRGSELRLVGLCRDISERTHAEQDRQQLVSITQNSSDVIFLASLTGAIRFINTAGCAALGLERPEDARSRTIFDFLSGSDSELMRFQIMPSVHRNQRWSGEVELQNHKTGLPIPTEATLFLVDDPRGDQPVAIAAICRDLSRAKHAEQQLRESEERYQMLAENPYDLISELDSEGRFVYVSPNFREILGYAPEDLLGRDIFQLLPPEGSEEVGRIFRNAIHSESTFHEPFRIRHQDNSYRWVDSTARAYRTAQGQVMAVLISRDITETRLAQDALRQSEEHLRQAQKMEAIGILAGGVAHDFNNLLTAIIGYCDLLLEEIGPDHPGRDDANEILRAADRAGALTRQLLAFSRRQVLQPKVLELNALVADIDRMLRRLIGEDIELRTVLDGELAPLKADPGQLEQVILNLVVNARDAMPRGGRITITTANEEIVTSNPLEEGAVPAGFWVTLRVADAGVGMDAATVSRVFDPFFTTKPTGEGTGLGLSTVIGIVTQSNGHIRVSTEPGNGATFTVYLPRAEGETSELADTTSPVRLRGNETILLVEDASPVRLLVERYLIRNGYTVLEASSSVAALRHCQRHPGPIHLLLTDVILPRMDGHELAQRVQDLRPDIRTVYMSGFTDDSLSRHGILVDDIILIEKPFAPATLLSTVRKVLDTSEAEE